MARRRREPVCGFVVINDVLVLLRDRLDAHLRVFAAPDAGEAKVDFVDGDKMDPIKFKIGAVSVVLINVEEETTLRPPDRHSGLAADGSRRAVQPEIRLNLYVLFVARFKDYVEALTQISRVIQYFQVHRVLDRENAPELGAQIPRLTLELVTLPISEQNELWGALRTTYHPSVLYKVGMVFFRDETALPAAAVSEKIVKVSG